MHNPAHALDDGTTILFHAARHSPAASDVHRWGWVRMSMYILQRARKLAVAVSVLLTVLLCACDSAGRRQSEAIQESSTYRAYLDGDVRQARQSLQQLIEYYRSPKAQILGPSVQAHSLFWVLPGSSGGY